MAPLEAISSASSSVSAQTTQTPTETRGALAFARYSRTIGAPSRLMKSATE
jgi:hypothetical protein